MKIVSQQLPPLLKLALPAMGAQIGMMLMGVVDTLMVSQLSKEALGATAIANAWLFSILWFGMGIIQGIDPLVSQAHGAKREDHALIAMKRGVVLGLLICVPLIFCIAFTEEILLFLDQEKQLTVLAEKYLRVQIWSIPFFFLFIAFRQYLQGREIVRPMLWIALIANVINAIANYVLIFGHFGFPSMGIEGAGIATAITRCFMFFGLWFWIIKFKLMSGSWLPLQREIYQWSEFSKIIRIGLPVATQIGFEILAFSSGTIIAGKLGVSFLAAHSITLNIASLAFMLPLGIAQGAATRVGNLIGARQFTHAKHAAWVAIIFGGLIMMISAIIFVLMRYTLPDYYTNDVEVILICASILPIAAAFQIVDGIQVVCSGVLRGMGRPLPSTIAIIVAFWVIGLPLGYWTSITLGYGIQALWWCLSLGLAIVAVVLTIWIYYRGPEFHAKQFE